MTLSVREFGDPSASTIVFLHGAGVAGWMWEPQVKVLGPRFRCLVPDLPGHGQSHTLPWISIPDAAARVADLIRERANGQAHIVGLSLGAQVAMQLLNDAPEVVDHAVLSGLRLIHSKMLERMTGLTTALMKFDFLVRASARSTVPKGYVERFVADAKRMSPANLQKAGDDSIRFELPPNLANAVAPTLAVAGEKELSLVKDSLPVVVKALPRAQARIAPKVGHVWNMEAPGLFSRMVEAWVTDQALPEELRSA